MILRKSPVLLYQDIKYTPILVFHIKSPVLVYMNTKQTQPLWAIPRHIGHATKISTGYFSNPVSLSRFSALVIINKYLGLSFATIFSILHGSRKENQNYIKTHMWDYTLVKYNLLSF